MVGVCIAAIVGIALTGARDLRLLLQGSRAPTVLAPWFALVWFVIGIVVTFA